MLQKEQSLIQSIAEIIDCSNEGKESVHRLLIVINKLVNNLNARLIV